MNHSRLQRRHFLAGAALSGLAGAAPAARAERGDPRMVQAGQSIDAMIADFMAAHAVPGLSLAIVQAPYITRVTGHGVADVGKRLLVATHTLFDLGQMVEAYTNVAVMQLVETGKLGLDAPIGTWLPELPAAWRAVTVRHVLLRASGLPDCAATTLAQAIALVGDRPPAFAPGSAVAVGATDHVVLRRLVEVASGETWKTFLRRHQFERLGLRHTAFASDAGALRREPVERTGNRHQQFLTDPAFINPTERATGYAPDGRAVDGSADALLASAMDVSLWDIGLAGGILVKEPAHRALLYAPTRLADGGTVPVMSRWQFPGRPGLMYIVGDTEGQSTFLSRFTASSELVCVTLLANKGGVDLTQLARRIAGAYDSKLGPPDATCIGLQQSPYPAAQTMTRLEAAAKAAQMDLARAGVTARAWEEQGQVWVCLSGPPPAAATQKTALDRLLLQAVSH